MFKPRNHAFGLASFSLIGAGLGILFPWYLFSTAATRAREAHGWVCVAGHDFALIFFVCIGAFIGLLVGVAALSSLSSRSRTAA